MNEPKMQLKKIYDNTDEQVSIIIIHRDKPANLNLCLQSISVTSLNNNYEIVVVDNGSEEQDSLDFLADLETQDCKVVRNKENLWWAKAANQGAKAASENSKYLIFLHHDIVILNPAWIDLLINVSESQDSGLVGVSMDKYEMEDVSGKKVGIDFIEEWCLMTTRECWQDCGPFEDRLEQVGAPFMYTWVSQMRNHKPQIVRNPLVHHYGVMAMDINDFHKFREKASATIPVIMREQQKRLRRE